MQNIRVLDNNTFQSACHDLPAILEVWNRNLSFSRFVSVFTRNGTTALYNSLNGGILYYLNSAFEPFRSFADNILISPMQMASKMDNDPIRLTSMANALNEMLELSFLIPTDTNEDTVVEKLRAAFQKPSRFENLTVYLTSGCNLSCDYCQLHTKPNKSAANSVDLDSFKQAVHVFFTPSENTQSGRRKLQIFGGEPLVAWARLVEMVEYIKHCENTGKYGDEQLYISINTNGVLLNDERLEFIKQNNIFLSISLDGGKEEHDHHRKDWSGRGTYQSVIDNIHRAREKDIDVTVLSVLGAHNLSTLPEFIESIRDSCGITNFGLNPIFGNQEWQNNFSVSKQKKLLMSVIDNILDIKGVAVRPFYDQWNEFSSGKPMLASQECILGTRMVLFPGGRVAPCVDYAFRENTTQLASFESLYPSSVWKEVVTKWSLSDPQCYTSCPLIGFCDGGCPVNVQFTEKKQERPFCNLSWALLESFIWRMHRIVTTR